MKKLIIAALLVIGFSSYAQQGQWQNMSPEQRTQAQLERLTTELKLDAKQQEQIKPILAEQTARREAMRAERMANGGKELTDEERQVARQKRTEQQAEMDNKLKAILTPEQFKKMKEVEQANMQRMREARGNN
jgi:protein CpxP